MDTDGSGQQWLKMHKETLETHKEILETCEVIDDQKVEAKKDMDMEDALSSGTTWWNEEEDIDLELFMDIFDDLLEKDETKNLEQDFIDSDPEEQVWESLSPTSSSEEDSSSDEEEEESVTGPSAKVSKFINMVLSPSNFFFFSNYLLQQH
jgi:hypothetical protein